jgi:ankyrin repeat protein
MNKFIIKIYIVIISLLIGCTSIEEKANLYSFDGDLVSLKNSISKIKTINFRDERGWTPLMTAAENNQVSILEYLISQKVYLDIKNESGDTALMRAVLRNNYKSAEILIKAGASLKIRDNRGYTPFQRACEKGYLEIAKLLIKDKSEFKDKILLNPKKSALHLAIKKDNLELMKWLLENGLDINTKDEDGKTPLMDAVSNLKPSTVKFLLEKGASVNDTSNNGEDILSISRQTLNNEMISIIENINRTFKK